MKKLAWTLASAGLLLAATAGIAAVLSGDLAFRKHVPQTPRLLTAKDGAGAPARSPGEPDASAILPSGAAPSAPQDLEVAAQEQPALPQAASVEPAAPAASEPPVQDPAQPGWTVLIVRGMDEECVTFDDPHEKRPVLVNP